MDARIEARDTCILAVVLTCINETVAEKFF